MVWGFVPAAHFPLSPENIPNADVLRLCACLTNTKSQTWEGKTFEILPFTVQLCLFHSQTLLEARQHHQINLFRPMRSPQNNRVCPAFTEGGGGRGRGDSPSTSSPFPGSTRDRHSWPADGVMGGGEHNPWSRGPSTARRVRSPAPQSPTAVAMSRSP